MHPDDTRDCFLNHLGCWAYEPLRLQQALWALQRGLWQPQAAAPLSRDEGALFSKTADGVAIVRIVGAITKGVGKLTGTSTILTRRALRQATQDETVQSILLAIDSPGGQVSGVQDLADEVLRASQHKPVTAYIEDLGASAAYWIASQAQRITANRTAEIGSIGVIAVLEDLSGAAEREGVKVHVVTTSPMKAVGVPGTVVLPEHLAYVGAMVETIGGFFFEAVARGRKLSAARLAAVTDGRVWIAGQAQALGLIDGVESFEEALSGAARLRPRRRMAAGHSELAQLRAAWERS